MALHEARPVNLTYPPPPSEEAQDAAADQILQEVRERGPADCLVCACRRPGNTVEEYEVNDDFTQSGLGSRIREQCQKNPTHVVAPQIQKPYDLSDRLGPLYTNCLLSR